MRIVRIATIVVVIALLSSACTSEPEPRKPHEIACGVLDMTALRQAVDAPELQARGTSLSGEQLRAGDWHCELYYALGSDLDDTPRKTTFEIGLFEGVNAARRVIQSPKTVSIGNGVDGAVSREWSPDALGNHGYVTFACDDAATNRYTVTSVGGLVDDDLPSYRQIATVYVVVANQIRDAMGCGGKPYPLPQDLPSTPPEPNPLSPGSQPCDTFGTSALMNLLRQSSPEPRTWHSWHSPGSDFPATTCQLWRERDPQTDGRMKTGDERYLFGPMIAFSRNSGQVGAQLNVRGDEEYLDNAESWDRFGGSGYSADNEMRLKRACGDETHVYVGAYAPHTVTRAQYEKLFTQWVRAQAQRDGCPVA